MILIQIYIYLYLIQQNNYIIQDYFISGIASGTKKEVDGDKYGFYLEDFMKYYVIYANKKKTEKKWIWLSIIS